MLRNMHVITPAKGGYVLVVLVCLSAATVFTLWP